MVDLFLYLDLYTAGEGDCTWNLFMEPIHVHTYEVQMVTCLPPEEDFRVARYFCRIVQR